MTPAAQQRVGDRRGNPEYATLRDLISTVEKVDCKLDEHKVVSETLGTKLDDYKLTTEKRLGRIEKGLLAVGLLAMLPHAVSLSSAVPVFHAATHFVTHLV